VFARRRELQRVNPIRHMERSGLTKRYALLNDEEKYRALEHFLALNQPPTMDTFQRASAHPALPAASGRAVEWRTYGWRRSRGGDARGANTGLIFLVVSTGTVTDLGLRPELSAFADDIALWGDRMRADKPNALIDAHPYLGSGFQMTAKSGEGHGRLHGLFMFNYAALASLGLSAAAPLGIALCVARVSRRAWRASSSSMIAMRCCGITSPTTNRSSRSLSTENEVARDDAAGQDDGGDELRLLGRRNRHG
jgi:hypothetical protein